MQNKKLVAAFICIVLVLLCMTLGCYSAESDTPYFPVTRGEVGMEALAKGTLILEDGYLRLSSIYSDDKYLIIWPNGYSLNNEGEEIQILDDSGQVVAKVGDTISAAGGKSGWLMCCVAIGKVLPFNCDGPYWISCEVKTI
jgi:hypothetical protein